ncbi:MAG: HlyD family efflux transporter periplasmic adaptor subunit, partial [Thermoguttaceae bacterium]|nr:HlyD family efflux transporter periplasmic adaptor subunit [Thermoguttaceae bacterium]
QQLLVAQKEVEKTLEVEVAQAACTVAEYAYKRADVLNQQIPGATPQEEMQEKLYEWIRAKKSIEQAEFNLDVKREVVKVREAELSAAQVEIEDRRFVSPIDGFIDDIMQNEGQWLREGDTILKIVRFDKMQLFGKIDARYYTPEMINGKTITVYLKKPGNTQIQTTEGKIVYVRQIVESGYFYFYAEVQNQCNESGYWLLNPGSIVTVVIRR